MARSSKQTRGHHARQRAGQPGGFSPLKVRRGTKLRIESIAEQSRMKLADTADVLVEAWERLTPEQQMDIIRRPAAELAS